MQPIQMTLSPHAFTKSAISWSAPIWVYNFKRDGSLSNNIDLGYQQLILGNYRFRAGLLVINCWFNGMCGLGINSGNVANGCSIGFGPAKPFRNNTTKCIEQNVSDDPNMLSTEYWDAGICEGQMSLIGSAPKTSGPHCVAEPKQSGTHPASSIWHQSGIRANLASGKDTLPIWD